MRVPPAEIIFSKPPEKAYTVSVMHSERVSIIGLNESALLEQITLRYGKGLFHCRAAMAHLYSAGSLNGLEDSAGFADNRALARRIASDFTAELPPVAGALEEEGTLKFTLKLDDGQLIESVIIPMRGHTTLCVSSQAGCARGCVFCRTARMGLARNLTVAEIIAQYMTARFTFGREIRNIVFMGMGEPLDNLESVLTAVDILTDLRGPALLPRRISISTCGQCRGLQALKERIEREPEKGYHLLTLGISLHAGENSVRSALMPVNRQWPLEELRATLLSLPQASDKDKIYFEYMIIPGLNDSAEDAVALRCFMEGLRAKVNLIAFAAPEDSDLPSASWADVDLFWSRLRALDVPCYSRVGKGRRIQASCGQLATGLQAGRI